MKREDRKTGSEATAMTTAEVALIFSVSPATIRRWVRNGKIRGFRISPRGALRFKREDVAIAYLDRSARRYLDNSH